ncbi:MAG TPA: PQQ-binding-like beta-propeller repeat protein [Verrucomicrobiae bacterium]|nr:PQQ-binding-like beta-propeller repeat protein [Verrucomicrobiae bacterium]
MKYTLVCVALLGITDIVSAAAGDWPQWRGPNHDGISTETGLLKEWPQGGPKRVWEVKDLGHGFGSVSVFGDRLFTAGDKEGASFVEARNIADGKAIWSAKLGKAGEVGQPAFAGPRATPTTDGELVFGVSQWGDLVCYQADSGKEVWRKDYTKDFGGTAPDWGYAESPLIDGNLVAVTPGGSQGTVVALDKKSGAVAWRSKDLTDLAHYSSLIVAELGGVRQYIVLTPDHVAGIAAADGKVLWKARRKGNVAVIPTPVYSDGFVYVTSGYGVGCNLFKVTSESGKFSAEQVYANKVMVNHHGGVIKVGDYVYGYSDGKGWTCQNFKTGEAKWQDKEKLGKGSLVCADGHFYLRQEDRKGTIALIEASPEGYQEHGRFDQPDRSDKNSWPHPVVAGGHLYIRDQDVLLCYDVKGR